MNIENNNFPRSTRFFLLVFGALGHKTQRAQTGGLCAVAFAKVSSLRAGRASLFFAILPDAHFAVYGARRALRSKTRVSATMHRQGPRMATEARDVCFGITGARNRPIYTLLTDETCAQTPLGRLKECSCAATQISPIRLKPPKMAVFVANSPHRAVLPFFLYSCGPRPEGPFAPNGWPQNAAGAK